MFSSILLIFETFVLLLLLILITFLLVLKTCKGIQNKLFSYILETFLSPNIEKCIYKEKSELLSEVKLIKSKDPLLLKEGKVRILEIGPGGGKNFKYYPDNTSLICVDPNDSFQKYYEENKKKFPNVKTELFVISEAENLKEVKSDSVDAVVATHVLCSVDNVEKVLQEVKRVLMQGCRFYYLDHGIAKKSGWRYLIHKIVEPVWKIIFANCHITRTIGAEVERAGFSEVSQYYKVVDKFPFFAKFHVFGIATK